MHQALIAGNKFLILQIVGKSYHVALLRKSTTLSVKGVNKTSVYPRQNWDCNSGRNDMKGHDTLIQPLVLFQRTFIWWHCGTGNCNFHGIFI